MTAPRATRPRVSIVRDRSGSAGLVSTAIMSALGLVFGMAGGFLSDRNPSGESYAALLDLRDAPLLGGGGLFEGRDLMIAEALTLDPPERFAPAPEPRLPRPKIILIFDDMGPDPAAFERVIRLPGPLTLSFLPYAPEVRLKAALAHAAGAAVMLHLPMEPAGAADPGPGALKSGMSAAEFLAALDRQLGRFDGYVGVNNHMGSKLTQDEAAMRRMLAALKARDLFFLDSLTTGRSAAARAGAAVGATVYARDVFIDAGAGATAIARQLALVERIARETGFAIAIAHPRPETLDMVGPWLTSAPSRGFELASVNDLATLKSDWRAPPARVAFRD